MKILNVLKLTSTYLKMIDSLSLNGKSGLYVLYSYRMGCDTDGLTREQVVAYVRSLIENKYGDDKALDVMMQFAVDCVGFNIDTYCQMLSNLIIWNQSHRQNLPNQTLFVSPETLRKIRLINDYVARHGYTSVASNRPVDGAFTHNNIGNLAVSCIYDAVSFSKNNPCCDPDINTFIKVWYNGKDVVYPDREQQLKFKTSQLYIFHYLACLYYGVRPTSLDEKAKTPIDRDIAISETTVAAIPYPTTEFINLCCEPEHAQVNNTCLQYLTAVEAFRTNA